jgi:hypothetical protein
MRFLEQFRLRRWQVLLRSSRFAPRRHLDSQPDMLARWDSVRFLLRP